jgi:hypothetical protein
MCGEHVVTLYSWASFCCGMPELQICLQPPSCYENFEILTGESSAGDSTTPLVNSSCNNFGSGSTRSASTRPF